jgi:predicted acyltransferase
MKNSTIKDAPAKRLVSLDALRGFDMFWIIGGEYLVINLAKATNSSFMNSLAEQFDHVPWEGFRFYDLIMPLFLFMVGMSIPYALTKRLADGEPKSKIYRHALKRSVILFIFGMICQCHLLSFNLDKMHIIHDTLQSIAIGYFFSVIIFSEFKLKKQLIITSTLFLVFWAILTFVPVPGEPAGQLLPQNNIAKHIEKLVFGHFDDGPSDYTWFLSSLGFIITVMTGVFASTIIRSKNIVFPSVKSKNPEIHKTIMLAATGLAFAAAGQVANIWFPIIKHIWNPSFILFSSGLSFLLMALFYYIIDVKGYQRWAFWLKVIGMNSIFIYMASHLINFEDIAQNVVFGLEQFFNEYYPLIRSITALAIIYVMLYYMYKKGTFLKV